MRCPVWLWVKIGQKPNWKEEEAKQQWLLVVGSMQQCQGAQLAFALLHPTSSSPSWLTTVWKSSGPGPPPEPGGKTHQGGGAQKPESAICSPPFVAGHAWLLGLVPPSLILQIPSWTFTFPSSTYSSARSHSCTKAHIPYPQIWLDLDLFKCYVKPNEGILSSEW